MGLQDRDYMHERHRAGRKVVSFMRPPPERSGTSTLLIVFLVLATLLVAYKASQWWLDRRAAQPRTAPVTIQQQSNQREQNIPTPPRTVQLPAPQITPVYPKATAPAGAQAVTKCVVKGQTTYSDTECPRGATTATVYVRPDANQADATPVPPPSIQHSQPAQPAPPPQVVVVQNGPSPAEARQTECKVLSAQVESWDAMARQPQTGQMQDWIRAQRKAARDRQFALKC